MIKFSVVIPLYNKEVNIINSIESVLSQTYPHFELIIINDGSTDNSQNVAQDSINEDPRAKIVNQVNSGVSVARNYGASLAKYDYIAFLDADDLWHPTFLEVMKNSISEFPDEHWFGVSSERFIGDFILKDIKITNFKIVKYFEETIKRRSSIIYSGSFVVDKEAFFNSGQYPVNVTHWEDYELYFNLSKQYNIVWQDIVLHYYRMDAENQASKILKIREFPPFIKDNLDHLNSDNRNADLWKNEFLIARLLDWCLIALESGKCIGKLRFLPLKYALKCRFTTRNKKTYYKVLLLSILNILSAKLSSSVLYN